MAINAMKELELIEAMKKLWIVQEPFLTETKALAEERRTEQ